MSPNRKTGAVRALVCALSLSILPILATSLAASAKTIVFKQTGRDTPIVLPDAWKVSPIANGIEIRSDDAEVFIWVQAASDDMVPKTIDEYFAYFKQQGVTFTGGADQNQDAIAGVPVIAMDLPATYEGKKTLVRFIISNAKAGASKGVVIGYWASPVGDKAHDAAVTALLGDLLKP
jgi:hypothetical protein